MTQNGGRIKYRLFLLVTLLILIVSVGCSTMRNYFGRVFISDTEKAERYQEYSLKKLLANVRPQAGNPESHFLLGRYYQERGRHKEAISEYKKALLVNPQHSLALNGLGISFDLLGDYPKAIEAYQMALQLNPNQDYTYNNLGYSYLMQGNIEQAITSFKQALALNQKKAMYHHNLGLAYFRKGERDLALNELKSTGDEANAHYLIANLFYEEGAFQQAKEEYTAALKINPEMTQAKTKMEAADNLAKITESGTPKTEAVKPVSKNENSGQSPKANAVGGIEVSNGNGVNRMARGIAHYLKEHDLKVIRLTNADHFAYSESRLYCQKEFLSTAQEVNKIIPLPLKIQEVKKLDRPAIKVKLIIGKDLVNHKKDLETSTRS